MKGVAGPWLLGVIHRKRGKFSCDANQGAYLCGLTFELTPTAEAGGVSPVTDDATNGGRRAYDACRSGSGTERGVRPHWENLAVRL